MKNSILIFFILLSSSSFAQIKYNPLEKPNTYRNIDNPNYWKNKMPHPGYWQQDVHYKIKAEIDEETDIIDAYEELTYWNNSPDTLYFVFFHLYQNAFQPDSYYDKLQKENGKNPKYGKYESKKLGTTIEQITISGMNVSTELDNTILKVDLITPLLPGEKTKFEIKFKTYFDNEEVRRRMKSYDAWGYRHYNGVHWYPRISVYDAKFGWTTDQHLGREFYGNFGTFDVELTFASNFIVEATGNLLNRDEVLPADLRAKLDVKNFKDKPFNSPPSTIIEYNKDKHKTWVYHAENVHDFAFTADPTYRIGEARWEDKVCYSLVQEPHASKWQNAADFGAECLRVFSEDFGRYIWHKVIVADAADGMEYPMITLDSGTDPGYRDLLAHEIGHMWFFGQVGNNETYRALLDEGFTEFLTAWAMIEIDGEYVVEDLPKSNYRKKFHKPQKAIDTEVYNAYIESATRKTDPIISTHSDCFNGALGQGGGYRQVYYKTATMLYNLQYVLGDELFLDAMKYYFDTWKIAHPYNEDFRNAIIQYTNVDLNWFFDQWLDTDKRLDYSVKLKKNQNSEIISFKRKSRMQMPIDFTVIANDLKKYDYHIPNNWFVKETDAVVLPKWHGWDKLNPKYEVKLDIPSGIKEVIIDPTTRFGDIYMPDNSSNIRKTYSYDHQLYQRADWRNYEIKYRPNLWWNAYDGVKFGINLNGGYLNHHHLFDFNFWINSGQLQQDDITNKENYDLYSYKLAYNTNLDNYMKYARIKFNSDFISGLYSSKMSFSKYTLDKKTEMKIGLISNYRTKDENYMLYPQFWDTDKFNNRIDLSVTHKYNLNDISGKIELSTMSSALFSDYNYNKFILKNTNSTSIFDLRLKSRIYIQIGTGDNWASESKLFFAGANNEELMNNEFTRSKGFIPNEYVGYGSSINNFHHSGGLNLRGYAGYLVPQEKNGVIESFNYSGKSGAAVNVEIDLSKFLHFHIMNNDLKTYLFGDAGIITNRDINSSNYSEIFTDLRADAGVGFNYTVRGLPKMKPVTLRLDLPVFLNRPPNDEEYFKMRWIFGVNKLF